METWGVFFEFRRTSGQERGKINGLDIGNLGQIAWQEDKLGLQLKRENNMLKKKYRTKKHHAKFIAATLLLIRCLLNASCFNRQSKRLSDKIDCLLVDSS